VALGLLGIAAATLFTLRAYLDSELDGSILNVASIQAASLTEPASGAMRFHEWDLTPDEAVSVRDLVQYAQVWQSDGISLLRSQYMTTDLPLDIAHLARAGAGELVWADMEWQGMAIRSLFYPLERMGQLHERHVLQVAAPLEGRNQLLQRVTAFLGLMVLLLSAATFAGAWWLAERSVRPVHEVIGQAEAIGAGSLDRRIQAYADTLEYRHLVEVLNTMLGRIQRAFDAQRRFTADASHELRSPLTAMRGELEIALRRDRASEEYRQVLQSTLEEVVRLSTITEDLLTLARSDSGAMQPRGEDADLADVVERIAARLGPLAQDRGNRIETDLHPSRGRFDVSLVGQLLWNLMDNAVKFAPAGGRVEVTARREGDELVLLVADDGPGFGPDPEHIFDRFYRADRARTRPHGSAGTGLGLAIVKAVAEAHQGSVSAADGARGGARVTVRLPAAGAHLGPEEA
jgi:two-component system OmpR family sensor kinase